MAQVTGFVPTAARNESRPMMKAAIFIASTALLLGAAASAQQQPQPSGSFLEQLLGGMFGNNNQSAEQTLETDWNQGERPFERRRPQLDARIDAAVRDGSLSRNEADDMRREYDDIVRLEARYSVNGQMSTQQRSDLRSRYRALSQRVGGQTAGQGGGQTGYANDGNWLPVAQQNSQFEQRLATGLRNRSISQAEVTRLRTEWRDLAQVEARYQYNGIDAREQADLWDRYNAIDNRIGGLSASGFGNDRNTQRWTQMETRLAAAQRAGRISANQATQIRAQLGDLARLDAAYGRTGYSTEQRTYLIRRYGEVESVMGIRRQ